MEQNTEDMVKKNVTEVENNQAPVLEKLDEGTIPNYRSVMGEALTVDIAHANREDIIRALQSVQDPELFFSVYELGLIYEINQLENGDVFILMTLTSPTCPIAGEMPRMVASAVSSVPGVGVVTVELTFDPIWTVDRLSEEIKILMGID